MPQALTPTVQNHFIAGLKTEFTGLNFPENAATETANCVYSLIGDVTRRGGINFETNGSQLAINVNTVARSSFRWLNAGGDGESQIEVEQIGNTLYFFLSSASTVASPLSRQMLGSTVNIPDFQAQGSSANVSQLECQYAAGNGYLFVFHPSCDPFYCTYSFPVITGTKISLQIRDVVGINEPGVADNFRPNNLTPEHLYNLLNQGWTQGSGWTAQSSFNSGGIPLSNVNSSSNMTLQLTSQSSSSVIVVGDEVNVILAQCAGTGSNPHNNGSVTLVATVTSYNGAGGALGLSVTGNSNPALNATGTWSGGNFTLATSPATVTLVNEGFINAWQAATNTYPSNADVWWLYKNTTDQFSPSTTFANVQASTTAAPKGTFLLNPFIQTRDIASGVSPLGAIITTQRPATGTFYQGRVWYAGVNSSQLAQSDEPYYTWTENIYFSQIVQSPKDFSNCYQTNDPTSQTLFEILPSDGGVITIQGCGAIFKLFALRFGLLVFAANGIWFISGSTGVGFTADDFTVTKISSIKTISGTSFVDVQGYPFFWNQEGIYQVSPSSQPGSAHSPDIQLSVDNLTLGTILTYYSDIPFISKSFARGDYDYINYIIQWAFRSTPEGGPGNRYQYDTILNYNVVTKAFYPYSLPTNSSSFITGIRYIDYPGGVNNGLTPLFKYTTVTGAGEQFLTFSEENDFTNWVDFIDESFQSTGYNYSSFFITGFTPAGSGYLRKTQIPYLYLFMRNTPVPNGCIIQGIWDYASTPDTGRWSGPQSVFGKSAEYGMVYRKLKIRGRGLAFQMKVFSIPGMPFDIMGWSALDATNQGI